MVSLICTRCEQSYPADDPRWQCECGGALDIENQPVFDRERIASRKPDMWRYREALPIDDDLNIISFGEGYTPITEMEVAGRGVFVKLEHLFPTGSYKDRGAAMLISKARELGLDRVVEDSSGNAGCAIAAYCAKANIKCHIYVPRSTSVGKLAQIRIYGAEMHLVPGSRQDTAKAAAKKAQHVFYASHAWNPFFLHGTKTFAFECCEQLGWRPPDALVLPVGNGTLLLGAAIGFKELLQTGMIDKMPRLIAVQAAGCAPLHKAHHQGLLVPPSIEPQDTLAEGIAIASPLRGQQILQAVRVTNGTFFTVTNQEITIAVKQMGARGIFIEPTAAATIAGLKKFLAQNPRDEIIVTATTGHGLKSVEKFTRFFGR